MTLKSASSEFWPSLPLQAWQETYATLHMLTQIVGKIRLRHAPHVNHWWQVPLYITARGLTTSPIPHGRRIFEIDFDFLDHRLNIQTTGGADASRSLLLSPRPIAEYYNEIVEALRDLGLPAKIWPVPVEIENPIPFAEDRTHAAYDPAYARSFWHVLLQSDRVLRTFRSRFIGKCSPVHFFWGGFDMAVTRFSGRRALAHPAVPNVAHFVVLEAYSHEVSSCGFWPGGGVIQEPVYYSYAYPEPEGYKTFPIKPKSAYYSAEMGEFLLPYEAVRRAKDPDKELLTFLQTTYEAAAETGKWDRENLERVPA